MSLDGCYPAPSRLAKLIARQSNLKTAVAKGPGSVHRSNVVYVLRKGSSCGHVRMALRASSGLYILNSASGNIRVQGRGGRGPIPVRAGPLEAWSSGNPPSE